MRFSHELLNRVVDASHIIGEACPERAAEAAKLRSAVKAGSPILHTRFRVLLDNALGWGVTFPEEDKRLFGLILSDLGDAGSGRRGRPRGTGEDRTVTFRLRLTVEERTRLNNLAAESGITPSQYVRSKVFPE